MNIPSFDKIRVWLAFGVAFVADLLELPVTWLEEFHFHFIFLFGEFLDIVLDFITMGIMTLLLGWHPAFLPSLFLEAIPEVDLTPSWVASVAFVVWQRKKKEQEQRQAQAPQITPDATTLEITSEPTASRRIGPPPTFESSDDRLQSATPTNSPAEQRLKSLAELLDKNLISQSEYEAKKQKVLAEI